MEKHFIFVTIVVLISRQDCTACFTDNETQDLNYLRSGTSFYKDCNCNAPYTTERLKWLDMNNKEIGPTGPGISSKVYTVRSQGSLSIYIPSLSKTLSGTYKCVTDIDGQRYARAYKIEVYDPLYFFNTNETQYIIKGKDSLITCQARGHTSPLIAWYQNDKEIKNSKKYNITSSGLVINNVTENDQGIYKCIARVFATFEEVDRNIKVEMMIAPRILDMDASPAKTVIAGDQLLIKCDAEGYPYPRYFWNKTSETVAPENITWLQEVNKIEFDSIQPEDRGTYECIVQNDAGKEKRQITVEVLTPPTITDFPNITAPEGINTSIICRASGRPRPRVTIIYESDDLEDDKSITWSIKKLNETETELELHFDKLNHRHAGFYYCNASNEVSYTVETTYLTVLYKPYFEEPFVIIYGWNEKPVNLSCEHYSLPAATLEWRFQGSSNEIANAYLKEVNALMLTLNKKTDTYLPLNIIDKSQYGLYECTAKNYYGEAKKTFDVREGLKPQKVKNVTVIDVKATTATFAIEGPDNSGPEVIGFAAEYDEAHNYQVTNIHLNRTWAIGREYRLDKLKPMKKYHIKFAAQNEVGVGQFGNRISFNTLKTSVPEALEVDYESNVTDSLKNGDMVLKLKSPEENGDPIDYYALKYCPVSSIYDDTETSSCIEKIIEPTTEIHLNNLSINTTYSVEILAHNSEGNSTPTQFFVHMPAAAAYSAYNVGVLSGGAIIGLSIVVVIICIIILDVVLFLTRKQGMIASCCYKKNKKKKESSVQSRDKKGLLKDNGESVADDTPKRPGNGHKEYEYNKNTGAITGKHSAV